MKDWCVNSPPAASSNAKRNEIFIGGTGTGKTHLCIAGA
jgi:DNA replication protein DnaC